MPDDIDIRALAEAALRDDKAATPGPWFIAYSAVHAEPLTDEYARIEATIPVDAPDEVYGALPDTAVAFVPVAGGDTPTMQGGKDGSFISAARTREPELARAVLRLLDFRAAVETALDNLEANGFAETASDLRATIANLERKL